MMRNYEILNLWKFAFNLLNIGDELLRLVNLFLGVFEHFFLNFFERMCQIKFLLNLAS